MEIKEIYLFALFSLWPLIAYLPQSYQSPEAATRGVKKETLIQLFSCEFCKISKDAFFTEQHPTTASESQ